MQTVREVYEQYNIMPNLQMHQLRVAAVAQLICKHFAQKVNTKDCVTACLFHDMANIIKSDLVTFPKFVEPQGKEYWQREKDSFMQKYGNDEHKAALVIADEIGLPGQVCAYIGAIGFSNLEDTRDTGSFEQKITEYSDLRVGPHGVLSLDDRIHEASLRYIGKHPDMPANTDKFQRLKAAAHGVEGQIFEHCSIKPEDINDESVAPIVEELWDYPIS